MKTECSFIPEHNAEDKFFEDGYCKLGKFNPSKLESLKEFALNNIDFSNLFLNRAGYNAQDNHISVNTIPGRNLAEKADTLPIFSDKSFVSQVTNVVGIKWRVLDYKFVVALPDDIIPSWIDKDNDGRPIKNVGAYIKPSFRNCTYFRGIDFHQDIIDFPGRNPDFVTAYIYLDDVGIGESPLFILKGSHVIGPSVFPHDLRFCEDKDALKYTPTEGLGQQVFSYSPLLGSLGDVFCWHPFLLHGTYASQAGKIRISLRILIEKNSDEMKNCWLDKLTSSIKLPHRLSQLRKDLTVKEQSKVSENLLEEIRQSYIP